MSQKESKTDFNAHAGKIINVVEFEATLKEVKKDSYKGLSGKIERIRDLRRKPRNMDQKLWPTVYTADITTEVEQATENKDYIPVSKDKTYFEASSLLSVLDANGYLSGSFRKAIEKSADHENLLAGNTLSKLGDSSGVFQLSLNKHRNTVNLDVWAVPKQDNRIVDDNGQLIMRMVQMNTIASHGPKFFKR